MSRVVLVTGVSCYLGGRMARILTAEPDVARVIGVDVIPPRGDIGGAEFVRADIRNPIISKVIRAASVDTVVHMGVIATPVQAGGRMSMKEINVIGTMQLLAACQKAPTLQRLIVKSTSGCTARGPRTRRCSPRRCSQAQPVLGLGEGFHRGRGLRARFRAAAPDVAVTMLRYANFLGPQVETPMTRTSRCRSSRPCSATTRGCSSCTGRRSGGPAPGNGRGPPGTFNVAGDGILLLSQAARRAGRPIAPIPSPFVGLVGAAVRRAGLADFSPEQVRFLTYGRGIDTTRMRDVFGFHPQHTTAETFEEFVRAHDLNRAFPPERVEAVEQQLASLIGGKDLAHA